MKTIDVRYKGQNYIMFGKLRIGNGVTAVPEDEFYKLMKTPLFKSRVESGVFTLPPGTPLEKPKADKKPAEKVSEDVNSENQEEHENESEANLSVRSTIKNINESEDFDYLLSIIEKDERKKVKEAAQKRIDSLK